MRRRGGGRCRHVAAGAGGRAGPAGPGGSGGGSGAGAGRPRGLVRVGGGLRARALGRGRAGGAARGHRAAVLGRHRRRGRRAAHRRHSAAGRAPGTAPGQARWKTCSLRSRNLPSAFAMKFRCVESSWGGLTRWPGSTLPRTCGGLSRSCTSGTTATPSRPPCCCGCRSPCGCACHWLCATAASVPWAQQVQHPLPLSPAPPPLLLSLTLNSAVSRAWRASQLQEQFSSGGVLWFTDLTVPDSTWILPVSLGLVNLLVVEIFASQRKMPVSQFQKLVTNFFRVVSVVMIPIAATVPSSMALYWLSSSLVGLCHNLLLRSPAFRRLCRIPRTRSDSDTPYRDIMAALATRYSFSKQPH
ncbi:uncharacterized protein LOC134044724 isoform X1 [Cinclus cinclus]|uniref:uncharacterized protein LOC134044724 isoform X1 n=1 Tax=Cinclus cinclus TaxID=127875 RepID=UPI002E10F2D9